MLKVRVISSHAMRADGLIFNARREVRQLTQRCGANSSVNAYLAFLQDRSRLL
jgi:hypothetical protein